MSNEPQNPISEENPIPASPQEPTADIPVPATDSTPAEMPPEVICTSKTLRNHQNRKMV